MTSPPPSPSVLSSPQMTRPGSGCSSPSPPAGGVKRATSAASNGTSHSATSSSAASDVSSSKGSFSSPRGRSNSAMQVLQGFVRGIVGREGPRRSKDDGDFDLNEAEDEDDESGSLGIRTSKSTVTSPRSTMLSPRHGRSGSVKLSFMTPTTLEELFADAVLAQRFREYVAKRRSPEVILFRESVEAFRKASSPRSRKTQAKKIIDTFINPETAASEINLPANVKSQLLEATTEEWAPTAFDLAFNENDTLIYWNFFESFIKETSSAM